MKALSGYLLGGVCLIGSCLPLTVGAYSPTSADDELLHNVFQRMETLYLHNTPKLLSFYESLPLVSATYRVQPRNAYLLERIENHLKLLLFTSVYEDKFVCLPEYVQEDDTVTVNYSLSTVDGELIDTTRHEMQQEESGVIISAMPMVFNAGNGQIIKGFDEAVLGMQQEDFKRLVIAHDDAFGAWNPSLLKLSSRAAIERKVGPLSDDQSYTVTMTLMKDGESLLSVGRIVEMTETTITIDFNHPFAGQMLLGDIELVTFFKACSEDTHPLHLPSNKNIASEEKTTGSGSTVTLGRTNLK